MAEATMDALFDAIEKIGDRRFIPLDPNVKIEQEHRRLAHDKGFRLQRSNGDYYLVRR
jgi:hypothetical protein